MVGLALLVYLYILNKVKMLVKVSSPLVKVSSPLVKVSSPLVKVSSPLVKVSSPPVKVSSPLKHWLDYSSLSVVLLAPV